jgi:ATP-dependent helicase/nuclease subunit A
MSNKVKTPADQPVRDRLVTEFDKNFLVEAGAGSGKTYSLAMRMAAGIETGHYTVEHMAAVTFTRKAAAELRGRFQLALEERLHARPPVPERQRLEAALSGLERLFAGTIHAFCAHLLPERPVDARMAPGFVELDDVENMRQRERAWRDYVSAARARGFASMLELIDAGVKPKDLDQAFAAVCEHEDVTFDMGGGEPPALDAVLKQVERFWKALAKLKPDEFAEETKCKAQLKYDEFGSRLAAVRRSGSMARLGSLLTFWNKTSLTPKWWGTGVGRDASFGKDAKELVETFQAEVVDPFITQWRAYLHQRAMAVLVEARDAFARDRRRLNVVNYVDLLRVTCTMLRSVGDVRRALQRKYRWLFVDEFQDTDPIQAEIFLMLAADEQTAVAAHDGPTARGTVARSGAAVEESPAYALGLRPGALFVVGDPKQSIFRFRRADIDIYNRVAKRIVDTGGEVLSLTANFRSLPEVCELANTVFPPLFAGSSPPYSPAFEKLDPVRPGSDSKQVLGVATLTVPEAEDSAATVAVEARLIASYVHAEVASKRRAYGDFLVITRLKPRLGAYAEGFDALEIPTEVSGAGLFCASAEVQVLASLLRALADPLDAVALVGVLRGPLFGLSDPDLFRFHQAGGRFELNIPLPEAADAKAEKALETTYGPALSVMRQLREMLHLTRRLPLAAAIDAILDCTGWLALAATTPGGARAGHLLQAVDRVRQIVESGGGLVDAADALSEDESSSESEAQPLEPGRRNVVRLMNLHKAKGLEAPVVILADPLHTFEFPISLRVERDGSSAKGHLRLVRKNASGFGGTTLAQPIAWDAHEEEEKKYVAAERLRLLYVAGTRAKDLLVVCRSADGSQNKAWREFEGYLDRMPALTVALAKPVAVKLEVDLSAKARAAADSERAARHVRVRAPSWTVATPTGEKARLAAAKRAKQIAGDAAAAGSMPDTASHRVDGGAAWGSLLHGLLEHAMRHGLSSRQDLARLAQWLTVETPDLRPFIPEALDWVDDVRQLPFWRDASASGERHVEVPFAVRLEQPVVTQDVVVAQDFSPACIVLRGVIDLVHQSGEGWRILDYKSDQLDGIADVDAELLARYGPQLAQYKSAWEQATGGKVASSDLVALRAKRTISVR